MEHLMMIVTVPNMEEAHRISRMLVEERLAACVNRLPVGSIYRWKGKVEEENEVMLLCKTRQDLLDRFVARVKELHPYEVPEIIALPIVGGSADYLSWLDESTGN